VSNSEVEVPGGKIQTPISSVIFDLSISETENNIKLNIVDGKATFTSFDGEVIQVGKGDSFDIKIRDDGSIIGGRDFPAPNGEEEETNFPEVPDVLSTEPELSSAAGT